MKKLIATCWQGSSVAEYRGEQAKAYKAVVTGVRGNVEKDIRSLFKLNGNELTELQGAGDFRSEECLSILDEADVVVTNPPFSLFREYIAVMMEHKKKFVVIGNLNAVRCKKIFPLLKDNKVWLGLTYPKDFISQDRKIKRFGNIRWFTNLDPNKHREELKLVKQYVGHEDDYPQYDNYDAINISKVVDIPADYAGVMGVPVTFFDKCNPEQFEILGVTSGSKEFDALACPTKHYENPLQHNKENCLVRNGSKANTQANLKSNTQPQGVYYTADNVDGYLKGVYMRMLIRNKQKK